MMGFLAREILRAVQGWWVSGPQGKWIRGAAIDSRQVKGGELFVALPGEHTDGHLFVNDALQRGAAGAMVARSGLYHPEPSQVLLRVNDTLWALGEWGRWHRERLPTTVVAITGSCGKTTTKALTAATLSQVAPTLASPGNYNTEIGVPLTLLDLQPHHAFAVLELAMRGKGQIGRLARLCRPFVGVITNVGLSHAQMFRHVQEIVDAKGELLEHLPSNGVAVLHRDSVHFQPLREKVRCRLLTFGLHSEAKVRAEGIRYLLEGPQGWRMQFRLVLPDGSAARVHLRLLGEHNVMNALAAAAVGYVLQVPLEAIVAGLESVEGLPMRTQLLRTPSGIVVLHDAYNAAPDSMAAALETLIHLPAQRHGAALGDMKELGELETVEHLKVGRLAAEKGLDFLITVGEGGRLIAQGAQEAGFPPQRLWVCASNEEALSILRGLLQPQDAILVKGSRAMNMEEIVHGLLEG